jgi:hypothetical protein
MKLRQQRPPQQNQILKSCAPSREVIRARRSARRDHTTPPATSNRENPPFLSGLARSLLAANHSPLATAFLFGSPVIRILFNPFRISHNLNSNRRKTPLLCPERFRGRCVSDRGPFCGIASLSAQVQASRTLIGPPVIRIRSKPSRISADPHSNRRKRHASSSSRRGISNRNTASFTFPANSKKKNQLFSLTARSGFRIPDGPSGHRFRLRKPRAENTGGETLRITGSSQRRCSHHLSCIHAALQPPRAPDYSAGSKVPRRSRCKPGCVPHPQECL